MKFGMIPITDADGAILAHSTRVGERRLKKGWVLTADDVTALRQAGFESVVGARLEAGDVDEDSAAARLGQILCGKGLDTGAAFTGRSNLLARERGILKLDPERIHRFNSISADITVATLAQYAVVEPKQMVATVKIIPFAVAAETLALCEAIVDESGPLLEILPIRRRRIGLIQTRLEGLKESVLDKTRRVLDARLHALDAHVLEEIRCEHQAGELAAMIRRQLSAGADMVLVVGASAIVDRRDVIPAAIEAAGGRIEHFGMPVDPGNLLLLGYCGDVPTLGLPGCARSPKANGFDPVLEQLSAGLQVTSQDIMGMGVGGLLKEIPIRPQPRAERERVSARAPRIAALILAAGQSRRMGSVNKLLIDIDGKPMLRRVTEAVRGAGIDRVYVVTGFEQEQIRAVLAGLDVEFISNPAYADGLSTSVRAGLAALPVDVDGALVCLGDMPDIAAAQIDRLAAAFDPVEGRAICVPTYAGKRGNPILWSRRFFSLMRDLSGDTGAKHLLGEYPELVCEVAMDNRAVLQDIDTLDALRVYREESGH